MADTVRPFEFFAPTRFPLTRLNSSGSGLEQESDRESFGSFQYISAIVRLLFLIPMEVNSLQAAIPSSDCERETVPSRQWERKYCPHCCENVSKTTYYRHRARYINIYTGTVIGILQRDTCICEFFRPATGITTIYRRIGWLRKTTVGIKFQILVIVSTQPAAMRKWKSGHMK